MKPMRVVTFLIFVLASTSLFAANDANPPDPGRLSADWWSYFVIDEETKAGELDSKISSSKEYLEQSKSLLKAEQQENLQPKFDQLLASIEAYKTLKNAKPLIVPPATVPAQAYDVEKIFQLSGDLRRLQLESKAEEQEIERLREALKRADAKQSELKIAYLDLSEGAPERVEQGLSLMQSRFTLEIAKEQLKRKRSQLEILTSQVTALQNEMDVAFDRFKVDPDRVSFWENQRAQAIERLNELNRQLTRTQIDQSSSVAVTPVEKAESRYSRQKIALLEVKEAIQQLYLAKAELAIAGIKRVLSDYTGDTASDRDLLNIHRTKTSEIKNNIEDWERTTTQSRITATEQLQQENESNVAIMVESRIVLADETEQELRLLEEELSTVTRLDVLIDHLLDKSEGRLGQGIQFARDAFLQSWQATEDILSKSLFEIGETPVTAIGLLRLLFVIVVAWWISKFIRRGLNRFARSRKSVSEASVYALGQVLHYFVLVIAVLIGLSSIGVDFTKFALVASALGIGIGFGLQNLVSNFVSGLIILFEKSLKVGDFVELESGVSGEVKEINMRSTLVTTNDNVDILVPNSEFVNGRVINWTMREAHKRVHIPFGVAYGTDKELVKKAALEAADSVQWTLKQAFGRAPQVWFVEFGDSSLNFELVVWLIPEAVKRPAAVNAAYMWELETRLAAYNIEVPFPQRDVHLRSAFGRTVNENLDLFENEAQKELKRS